MNRFQALCATLLKAIDGPKNAQPVTVSTGNGHWPGHFVPKRVLDGRGPDGAFFAVIRGFRHASSMASLLLWVQWDGNFDEAAWAALAAAASRRSRLPPVESHGSFFRALAAPTRANEGLGLIADETAGPADAVVLLDRASDRDDLRTRGSTAPWTPARLFDGRPSAAVCVDLAARAVTLHRDVLGQRNLVYAEIDNGLVIASGESVLLRHPAVAATLNREWLGCCLVWVPCAQSATPFAAVRRVEPGASVRFDERGVQRTRRVLEPDDAVRGLGDAALVARFRELLEAAVADACLGAERVGVSLSAGLDSGAVAAIAARNRHRDDRTIVAVTQGLADWPDIDERALVAPLVELGGIDHTSFCADGLLPFSDPALRPVCPDVPVHTPFREWKERSYCAFTERAVDVVLTGNFGDHHFLGADGWAMDAVRFRRPGSFVAGLGQRLAAKGLFSLWRDPALRRLVSEPLGRADPLPARIDWLAPELAAAVRTRLLDERASYRAFPRLRQTELCLSSDAAADACGEDWFAQRHGIEFRSPFRDPALTRFCLSIPADLSRRHGHGKWLLREALTGVLPDALRLRPKGSDLTPWEEAAEMAQRPILARLAAVAADTVAGLMRSGFRERLDPAERAAVTWCEAGIAAWQLTLAGHDWADSVGGR